MNSLFKRILKAFFVLFAFSFLGISFLLYPLFFNPLLSQVQPIILTVMPGDTIQNIAGHLHEEGLLPHPRAWITFTILARKKRKMEAGEYQIDPGMTAMQLL